MSGLSQVKVTLDGQPGTQSLDPSKIRFQDLNLNSSEQERSGKIEISPEGITIHSPGKKPMHLPFLNPSFRTRSNHDFPRALDISTPRPSVGGSGTLPMSINPISGTFRDLTFLSPSGDEFQLTWDGHIYCEDRNCTSPAGSVWCPHLEDLVIKGWDGIPIFKMPLSIGEFDLMIPIFPTTDQWAKVHLVDPDAAQDEHTRWTVYWDECPTVVRPENAYPSSVYVTTLTSGEG